MASVFEFVKCIVYISSMHEMNIRNLDLNLLIALKILLEECHVSRAAERINLSQPAMSRALGRLRSMFNDPLLVKSQHGLVLTDRATQLLAPLQSILANIEGLVLPPQTNPRDMRGEIRIATRDNELVTILPEVIRQVNQQAPNLQLNIVSLSGNDLSPLEQHNVDFILSGTKSTIGTFHQKIVYEEGFICLVDKNNTAAKKLLTIENYIQMKHCLVTIANIGSGLIDQLLEVKKLKRNVVVKTPFFSSIPYVISNSDLIVTLPARLGKIFLQHHSLRCLQPPIEIPKYQIYLYWHPKHHYNPIHQWIRKLFYK